MPEITFSTMIGDPRALGIEKFMGQSRFRVRHQLMPWSNAWNELLGIGLHNRGPDVSQVGTTWIGSLAGMQALRPFTPQDINRIGSAGIFLPSAWQASMLPNDDQVYAIPWIADTRVLVYRRDLLKKAGVDEQRAFVSHDALVDTLNRLQIVGVGLPLAIPTAEEVIHNVAPWVWGAGGHFRTADRRHLDLTNEKTIAGIEQFYSLHRWLMPEARNLNTMQTNSLFAEGRVAVILTVHTLIHQMILHSPPIFGLENLGAALCPGVPFIGGSSLVIWRHTIEENGCLELIRFLSTPEAQRDYYINTSELPTTIRALEDEVFTTNLLFQVIAKSLQTGKVFQSGYHWASVESRLYTVFNQLWQDAFNEPEINLKLEITRRLGEISNRIEKTLLSA